MLVVEKQSQLEMVVNYFVSKDAPFTFIPSISDEIGYIICREEHLNFLADALSLKIE